MNELTIITDFGRTLDGDSRGPSPELWPGGVAAAAAAAVFAASSPGLWGAPQAASAGAAVLLGQAATVAARAPVQTPSADQFIVVKSVETAAVITNSTSVREQTDLREVWASVDGTRVGLIRTLPAGRGASWRETSLAGCKNGAPTGTDGAGASARCSPTPAIMPGCPRRPERC